MKKTIASAIILGIFAAIAMMYLTGCAFLDSAKGQAAIRLAGKVITNVAVAELQTLASGEGDFAHSAAQAAWSSVSVADLANALLDSGVSPAMAVKAQSIASRALETYGDTRAVLNAVATAISTGAAK